MQLRATQSLTDVGRHLVVLIRKAELVAVVETHVSAQVSPAGCRVIRREEGRAVDRDINSHDVAILPAFLPAILPLAQTLLSSV